MGADMDLKNQKGQLVIESVLLMVVAVGFSILLISQLKKMDYVKNLTFSPWDRVSGMVQCGVWAPCGISVKNPGKHPSNRVVSYRPKGQ